MNYAFYFSASLSKRLGSCAFASDEYGRAPNLHEISIDLLLNSNKLSVAALLSFFFAAALFSVNSMETERNMFWQQRKKPASFHANPSHNRAHGANELSADKRSDYTMAWHTLNFHMNCNLSIVVIEQNSQYLFLASMLHPISPSLCMLSCIFLPFDTHQWTHKLQTSITLERKRTNAGNKHGAK